MPMLFWRVNIDITGRIAMRNLDNVSRSRDITFLIEVPMGKAIFPVVLYGCESRTIKKAEHQTIDFQTVVLEKTPQSLGQQGDQTSQS